MPRHTENRKVPYTQEQMFDLVADVDSYADFLPWCLSSRITGKDGDVFFADLVAGCGVMRESFTSRVTALRPDRIHVEFVKGPMHHLSNHWRFIEQDDGSCLIDFKVDFEFKNPLIKRVMNVFFNEITRRMVGAFETRARELYG